MTLRLKIVIFVMARSRHNVIKNKNNKREGNKLRWSCFFKTMVACMPPRVFRTKVEDLKRTIKTGYTNVSYTCRPYNKVYVCKGLLLESLLQIYTQFNSFEFFYGAVIFDAYYRILKAFNKRNYSNFKVLKKII